MLKQIGSWGALFFIVGGSALAQQPVPGKKLKDLQTYSAKAGDVLSCMQKLVSEVFTDRNWEGMKWYQEGGRIARVPRPGVASNEFYFFHEFTVQDFKTPSTQKVKFVQGFVRALYTVSEDEKQFECRLNARPCKKPDLTKQELLETKWYVVGFQDQQTREFLNESSILQRDCSPGETVSLR